MATLKAPSPADHAPSEPKITNEKDLPVLAEGYAQIANEMTAEELLEHRDHARAKAPSWADET